MPRQTDVIPLLTLFLLQLTCLSDVRAAERTQIKGGDHTVLMEQIRPASSCAPRTHGALHISIHVEAKDHQRVTTLAEAIEKGGSEDNNIHGETFKCFYCPCILKKVPKCNDVCQHIFLL